MDDIQDKLHQLRQHTPRMELGNNFEERVFAKIKRKKKQRKALASVSLGVVLVGALLVAQATLFQPASSPDQPTLAQTNPAPHVEKEEIAVIEDVVFASSDDRSAYVIEKVGYTPKNNTL